MGILSDINRAVKDYSEARKQAMTTKWVSL